MVVVYWWDASLSKGVDLRNVSNYVVETPMRDYGLFAGYFTGEKSRLEHVVVIREVADGGRKAEWISIPRSWVTRIEVVGEVSKEAQVVLTPGLMKKVRRSIKENRRVVRVYIGKKKAILVMKKIG
jgi:hypothetical protein